MSIAQRTAHLAAAAPALPGSAASAARSCAASVATAAGRGARERRGGLTIKPRWETARPSCSACACARTERGVRGGMRLQRRDGVFERRRADGSRGKRRDRGSGILCHRALRLRRRAERGGVWPAARHTIRTMPSYEASRLPARSWSAQPARDSPAGRQLSSALAAALRARDERRRRLPAAPFRGRSARLAAAWWPRRRRALRVGVAVDAGDGQEQRPKVLCRPPRALARRVPHLGGVRAAGAFCVALLRFFPRFAFRGAARLRRARRPLSAAHAARR